VLKDPVKFNQVANEVVRRGYCTNDTTIITQVTDTVIIKDEQNLDTIILGQGICDFDTVLKSGTRIKFDQGILLIKEKTITKTRVITKQLDNYIRDTKFEEILKVDIVQYKDTISELGGLIIGYKEQIIYIDNKLDKMRGYLIIICSVIVGIFVIRIVKTFKPL
jgi:hypothetical protein